MARSDRHLTGIHRQLSDGCCACPRPLRSSQQTNPQQRTPPQSPARPRDRDRDASERPRDDSGSAAPQGAVPAAAVPSLGDSLARPKKPKLSEVERQALLDREKQLRARAEDAARVAREAEEAARAAEAAARLKLEAKLILAKQAAGGASHEVRI